MPFGQFPEIFNLKKKFPPDIVSLGRDSTEFLTSLFQKSSPQLDPFQSHSSAQSSAMTFHLSDLLSVFQTCQMWSRLMKHTSVWFFALYICSDWNVFFSVVPPVSCLFLAISQTSLSIKQFTYYIFCVLFPYYLSLHSREYKLHHVRDFFFSSQGTYWAFAEDHFSL